jgi:hypothetical protein
MKERPQAPDAEEEGGIIPIVKMARGGRVTSVEHRGDTVGTTWLHGGDPTGKPGYVRGLSGKQKKPRKWPY